MFRVIVNVTGPFGGCETFIGAVNPLFIEFSPYNRSTITINEDNLKLESKLQDCPFPIMPTSDEPQQQAPMTDVTAEVITDQPVSAPDYPLPKLRI